MAMILLANPARADRLWSWLAVIAIAMTFVVGPAVIAGGASPLFPPAADRPLPEPTAAELQTFVDQLGHHDYAVRELASQRLAAAGAAAADLLLAAAEESADLEVALRARWLAESIPLATGRESPAAGRLLKAYSTADLASRIMIMRQLLRLDDDAGVESLARIVRLDQTAVGSQLAAALLTQDWEPADPFWPRLAPAILAGLGTSSRPAARFLRGLVTHTTADSPIAAARGVDACAEAVDAISGGDSTIGRPFATDADELPVMAHVGSIFRRCLAALRASQGRRAEALAAATPLFEITPGSDAASRAAVFVQWLTAHGLPEAVELVPAAFMADPPPLLAYTAALAWREQDGPEAAAKARELAELASLGLAKHDLEERLRVASLLARWGGIEWAEREYRICLEAAETRPIERALVTISLAELLHDQERDAAAADMLRTLVETDAGRGNDLDQELMQLGREPRAIRSRMLFFAACAAPDNPTRLRLLDESLEAFPDDVDSLIAAYHLAADEPARREQIVARITKTAAAIDQEIRELPTDSVRRNEYAWLVANTEGDLAKALGYSRQSLEEAFDTASFLDTLAHCHAAAGNLERALRTQWLAVKKEPHSLLIRRNFARFRAMAAAEPLERAIP
jgi:hypothetical protein